MTAIFARRTSHFISYNGKDLLLIPRGASHQEGIAADGSSDLCCVVSCSRESQIPGGQTRSNKEEKTHHSFTKEHVCLQIKMAAEYKGTKKGLVSKKQGC